VRNGVDVPCEPLYFGPGRCETASFPIGGDVDKPIQRVLLTERQLAAVVARLGRQISEDYAGKDLVLVCILRGAVVFLADLLRHISIPCSIDFMAISSYGCSTTSSGVVRIQKDLADSVEGKHVLVVEDILDTGHTLGYIKRNLLTRKPASLRICTLLAKEVERQVVVTPEYVGAVVPDEFVVGYGLDFAQKYRNLPEVCSLGKG
jgi:hypoxanthine phosphoribosyltransferase